MIIFIYDNQYYLHKVDDYNYNKKYKKLLKRIILNISNIRSSFALITVHDDHFSANLKGMMYVVPDDVLYEAMWQIRNLSSYSIYHY